MRDYGEEASLLDALARHLAPFRVLITYNGRTFDQPLLETRYRMNRARRPLRAWSIWICCTARAGCGSCASKAAAWWIWKTRFWAWSAKASARRNDPVLYFEYLRTREAARLLPMFHHNAIDILSLACLTAIVPLAFQSDALG